MSRSDANFYSSHASWNLQQAELFTRQRRWAEADTCFASAVAADESPVSCLQYGCALVSQERYHDAIQQLTTALDRASFTGDRDALAAIFHNLAAIYRDLGDFDLARRFQQRAISQTDDCGPDELLGLANDAWVSGRSDMAEFLSESATELGDTETADDAALAAQATLGVLAGVNGDPRAGIRSLLRVYRAHQANGDFRGMGTDLLNLSLLYGELGRHRSEMSLVRRAIHCFEFAPAPISAKKARRLLLTLERIQSARDFDPSRN